MLDILIRGGKVIDGSGAARRRADIGVKDGIIREIGELGGEEAREVIDAGGLCVAPGFVDVNNHSDTYWQLFSPEKLESAVRQGITTIVGGNCGSSLAPWPNEDAIKSIQKWADIRRVSVNWKTVAELLAFVKMRGIPVNFATLVGASTLRRAVVGDAARALTPKEMRWCEKTLDQSIQEGAIGLSTGLAYAHGRAARQEEIVSLARIAGKLGGIYATHIRSERDGAIEAIEEAIETTRQANAPLHISHLKVMDRQNWGLLDVVLGTIDAATAKGADISFDVFPYTVTGSVLYTLLPEWVSEGGKEETLRRLADQTVRREIVFEMERQEIDYSRIRISVSQTDRSLSRRNIADIARAQNKSAIAALMDILLANEMRALALMDVLSEDAVASAITHPLSLIASDGAGYSAAHRETGEEVHPRSFGAFPRVLARYVREKKLLSWEEAIQKMTSAPARRFGIQRRGLLKEGNYADVVIFDDATVRDTATLENPYQYPEGIPFVIINGLLAVKRGEYVKSDAGRIVEK